MDIIKLQIASKSEYMKTVRLTSTSLASCLDFDIEKIEDLRVIVQEACNLYIDSDKIDITYKLQNESIEIEVRGDKKTIINKEDLGVQILKALSDEVFRWR